MTIYDILRHYGIIEVSNDKYVLEYFLENNNFKVYNFDFLPRSIPKKNIKKYDQVETLYQEAINSKIAKQYHKRLEEKYIGVFLKLWLYSDVFLCVDSLFINYKNRRKYIDSNYRQLVSRINPKELRDAFVKIDNKREMEFYTILGTRNIANVIYFFSDLDILVFTNWSCFSVVLLKEGSISFIDEIIKSEGLFLYQHKV